MNNNNYSKSEERLNVFSHGMGIILSVVAFIFLVIKSGNPTEVISSIVFGTSLILLYTASTLYHSTTIPHRRKKFRILDHAMIYVLIAGTYTPVCLITLNKSIGLTLLIIIWTIAFLGVILKLFLTGKYDKLSTILYVLMGWIAVFATRPLLTYMQEDGLLWLLYGGIFYTIGAIIYSIRNIPFNHALFHFFVLGGSICHFLMIYSYVL